MFSKALRLLVVLFAACAVIGTVSFLVGCSTVFTYPNDTTVEERLNAFPTTQRWPVESTVTIYWNDQMVPFVEADSDSDGAFAIGVVHAHLRLGQMEMFRRLSQGRLAEMGGPIALANLDQTIRTLDLEASAKTNLALMDSKDRAWLDDFVRGINYYVEHTTELPLEFRFLGLDIEPWTPIDVLRLSRLGGADPNWFALLNFLSLREEAGWQQVWNTFLERGFRSPTSFTADPEASLATLISYGGRVGSNSVVVSGAKRNGAGALIASDPHLGIFVPNLWLLMGYRTPSYHVLGYMLPGAPATVIGRNRHIAWGGTAMRSVSSHLFELDQDAKLEAREEVIRRRWWVPKSVTVRVSDKGPVVSDLAGQDRARPVALWWAGYDGSDELGSFLSASRSRDWSDFRQSFDRYAVGGLNVTYADAEGNVGMLLGTRQSRLADESEYLDLVKSATNDVVGYRGPSELPSVFNPEAGFIASANNLPVNVEPPVAFVSGDGERFRRWSNLLASTPSVSVTDLMRWQNDVFSADALSLKNLIVGRFTGIVPDAQRQNWKRLKEWDGIYDSDSEGAPVFELLTLSLATTLVGEDVPNKKLSKLLLSSDDWRVFLGPRLEALNTTEFNRRVLKAMRETQAYAKRFPTWGDMHIQPMRYPLGLIPVLGRRFQYFEYAAPGASSTLNKSGLGASFDARYVTFGAQARHISDLTDLNENYFVMHGGNDGWLNNERMTDQADAWRAGEYFRIPLELSDVRKEFQLATFTLQPME